MDFDAFEAVLQHGEVLDALGEVDLVGDDAPGAFGLSRVLSLRERLKALAFLQPGHA